MIVFGTNTGAIVSAALDGYDWAPPVHCSPQTISGRVWSGRRTFIRYGCEDKRVPSRVVV